MADFPSATMRAKDNGVIASKRLRVINSIQNFMPDKLSFIKGNKKSVIFTKTKDLAPIDFH